MIQKKKTFEISNVKYEVSFPTVGQYFDIENMKMMLTNNSYGDMLRSGLRTAYFAIDLVDCISLFYVLVPDLRKDLNVRNYNDLDPFLAKKIVKAYKSQIKEWYDELLEELLREDEVPAIEDEEEDEKE